MRMMPAALLQPMVYAWVGHDGDGGRTGMLPRAPEPCPRPRRMTGSSTTRSSGSARSRSRPSRSTSTPPSYANVRRFLNAGHAAAEGRGADRGDDQLLPLRLPAADRRRPVLGQHRGRRLPVERRAPPRADRPDGPGRSTTTRRPPSNLVFLIDVSGSMSRAQQAAAGQGVAPAAGRAAAARTTAWRSSSTPAPRAWCSPSTSCDDKRRDPRGPRPAAGRRLDQRRRGHPARLRPAPSRTSSRSGTNRVILATDGDFNVGVTEPAAS